MFCVILVLKVYVVYFSRVKQLVSYGICMIIGLGCTLYIIIWLKNTF